MGWLCALLTLAGLARSVAQCNNTTTWPPCTRQWQGTYVLGKDMGHNVCRYTVPYATADRWADSVAAKHVPQDARSMPPSCPQVDSEGFNVTGSSISEDCLYTVLYVPSNTVNVPLFIWIHGGSFYMGSAAAPGLDGFRLARQGMVVAVPQYRLGVLGELPPPVAPTSSDPNLALRDLILAMKTIKSNFPSNFAVTVGGQSSGASMIRALWGAPAARGLFQRMIMQSDPLTVGTAPTSLTGTLQRQFYASSQFQGCSTLEDFRAVPLADIQSAQVSFVVQTDNYAMNLVPGNAMRPTYGTASLPNEPISSLWYNPGALALPSSIPLLITSVADEGGSTVANYFKTGPIGLPNYVATMAGTRLLGAEGAATAFAQYTFEKGETDGRQVISRLLTDYMWRCPARSTAAKWAAAGGTVYSGEFRQGTTYPYNSLRSFCQGRVCHQDDIYPTFGTSPDPSSDTSSFENTIITAWTSFIKTGNPGSGWAPFADENGVDGTGVRALGGDGQVPACPAGFWGEKVKWNWQLYS